MNQCLKARVSTLREQVLSENFIALHQYSSGGFQTSAANSDCDKWENGGQLLKGGVNYSKIGDFLRQLPLK